MEQIHPLIILAVGIASVIGMIIVLRLNAFMALIISALIVSFMATGPIETKVTRVAGAFGNTAGDIGIVIAMAAIIGTCLMESGAADRIVRSFVSLLGEKRSSIALMGSGFVLSVPVFFDTVFYLLVPLGRSLYRRTGKHYLKYVMAIACGGAITHTLVPPTPGPLLVASSLGIDLGAMILVGLAVALPAAIAGLLFCAWADRVMPVPMRSLSGVEEPEPPSDAALPSLELSILPVALPVILISINTVLGTFANAEHAARFSENEFIDTLGIATVLRSDEIEEESPEARLKAMIPEGLLQNANKADLIQVLNSTVLTERKPGIALADEDMLRKPEAEVEHLNRLVLEEMFSESTVTRHNWETPRRQAANWAALFGNANFALLVATVIALTILARQRGLNRDAVAMVVEKSLMSAGIIILITSAGGAFGGMLQAAGIRESIQASFGGNAEGIFLLLVAFGIAAVLKVAVGSSTVAMIVGAATIADIIPSPEALGFHPAYLATAIGSGSLIGSWMNDSGFWVFAKMSGLTEAEALKSWTPLLIVLGVVGLVVSLILAVFLPLTSLS